MPLWWFCLPSALYDGQTSYRRVGDCTIWLVSHALTPLIVILQHVLGCQFYHTLSRSNLSKCPATSDSGYDHHPPAIGQRDCHLSLHFTALLYIAQPNPTALEFVMNTLHTVFLRASPVKGQTYHYHMGYNQGITFAISLLGLCCFNSSFYTGPQIQPIRSK